MISEQKFRMETPYGVKFFSKISLPKHFPHHPKYMGEKKFQKDEYPQELMHTLLGGCSEFQVEDDVVDERSGTSSSTLPRSTEYHRTLLVS